MNGIDVILAAAAIVGSGLMATAWALTLAGHGRSTATYVVVCLLAGFGGSGLAAGIITWDHHRETERVRISLTREIDTDEYHVVSLWRRSDCQLDALAGRALADGRISRGEYERMEGMAGRLRKEAARADAGGSSPARTCSVIPKS